MNRWGVRTIEGFSPRRIKIMQPPTKSMPFVTSLRNEKLQTAWQLKREGGGNNTSIHPSLPWHGWHHGQAGFPDFLRVLFLEANFSDNEWLDRAHAASC